MYMCMHMCMCMYSCIPYSRPDAESQGYNTKHPTVDSNKLEYGPEYDLCWSPSYLGFGAGGQSHSNYLPSFVGLKGHMYCGGNVSGPFGRAAERRWQRRAPPAGGRVGTESGSGHASSPRGPAGFLRFRVGCRGCS